MEQGIDGFYMDGAHVMFEVDDLDLDEPENDVANALPVRTMWLFKVPTPCLRTLTCMFNVQ